MCKVSLSGSPYLQTWLLFLSLLFFYYYYYLRPAPFSCPDCSGTHDYCVILAGDDTIDISHLYWLQTWFLCFQWGHLDSYSEVHRLPHCLPIVSAQSRHHAGSGSLVLLVIWSTFLKILVIFSCKYKQYSFLLNLKAFVWMSQSWPSGYQWFNSSHLQLVIEWDIMSSELFYAFVVVCWLLVGDYFRKIKTRSLMSLSIIKDLPKKKSQCFL